MLGRRSRGAQVAIALGATVAGFALRLALDPTLGDYAPWLPFAPAVLVTSAVAGFGAGLLATLLCAGAGAWLFLAPTGPHHVAATGSVLVGAFLLVGAAISWVGSTMRREVQASADREAQLRHAAEADREHATVLGLAPVFTRTVDGTIESWGAGAERLYGFSRAEAVGRSTHALMRTRLPEPLATIDAALLRTGRWQGRLEHVTRDGRTIAVSSQWALVRDPAGAPLVVVESNTDITDLERLERRFRAAQDVSLVGFTILRAERDADGRIVDFTWEYANEAAARMLGRPPAALLGRRLLALLPGNAASSDLFARYVGVVETGTPHDYELRYAADGIDGWFRNMCVKLDDGVAISFTDVTDRHRLEEALSARVAELADADRRKDEFLAMLGHELRTPLGAMRAAAHVLRRHGGPPDLVVARDIIDRQVAHMARLLEDLLDVSRIAHGSIGLRRERLVLQEVLTPAIDVAQPLVAHAHQTLTVTAPDAPVVLTGDFARLAQVFGNLLTNAAKFTDAGGRITVVVEPDGPVVRVRVRDTGRGIAPDLLPHVFELFVQGDAAPDRVHGGLGIGLTLVQRLVALHGGTVTADSPGLGQGSEFVVTLPRAAGDAPPA